jgi:cell division septation protein DedD
VAQTQDDAFHEIQLNGKQLVFLFMAATVVSVVIFLCGVLVGRSVRAERATVDGTSTAVEPPVPAPAPPPSTASDVPGTKTAPEDFTYSDLDKQKSKSDSLKADRSKAAADSRADSVPPAYRKAPATSAPAVVEKTEPPAAKPEPAKPAPSATANATPPAPTATTGSAASEPSGQGFAVQIAALNVRSEADAIARKLTSKGYSAYVLAPATGTPSVFRVRVGKFSTRREAETVAAKLQKEEQLKPWVTR